MGSGRSLACQAAWHSCHGKRWVPEVLLPQGAPTTGSPPWLWSWGRRQSFVYIAVPVGTLGKCWGG